MPVVLPAKSAFPELVDKSGGGVLYPAEDRFALVEALEKLLADEAQRQQLSITGRKTTLEFFSMKRAGQEMLDLIRELF